MENVSHDAPCVNGVNAKNHRNDGDCKGWKQRDRIKKSSLGRSDKAVLDALVHHTNDAHFQAKRERLAWPEQIDLELESGLSNKSVRRALKRLVATGLVTITRQRGADGRLGRNYYTLYLDKLVPAERPARKAPRRAASAATAEASNDSAPVVTVTGGPVVTVTDGDEGDQRSPRPIINNKEINSKEQQQRIGAAADLEAAWAGEKRGDYPGVRNWDAFRRSQIAKGVMPQRDDCEERPPQKLGLEARESVDPGDLNVAQAYSGAVAAAMKSHTLAGFKARYPNLAAFEAEHGERLRREMVTA